MNTPRHADERIVCRRVDTEVVPTGDLDHLHPIRLEHAANALGFYFGEEARAVSRVKQGGVDIGVRHGVSPGTNQRNEAVRATERSIAQAWTICSVTARPPSNRRNPALRAALLEALAPGERCGELGAERPDLSFFPREGRFGRRRRRFGRHSRCALVHQLADLGFPHALVLHTSSVERVELLVQAELVEYVHGLLQDGVTHQCFGNLSPAFCFVEQPAPGAELPLGEPGPLRPNPRELHQLEPNVVV